MISTKILSNTTGFNIDNKKKCILITKSPKLLAIYWYVQTRIRQWWRDSKKKWQHL